jgi:hypothetical protein
LFKEYADKLKIPEGQLAYGEVKAKFDAVIAELITALTEGETRKAFPVSKPIWNMARRVLGNSARWSTTSCQALRDRSASLLL